MPDLKDLEGPAGKLNRLGAEEARAALLACCGSTRWASEVAALRPFWDVGQLLRIGRRVWFESGREDWLEAFRAHPRIGESKAAADTGEEAKRWSEGEQSRAREADAETIDELARANREYEERFGFIYIVCATGRTAEELLALLRQRLSNDPDTELRVAAEEQWRITELRLKKFLNVK
ncbi:MAG TPA: 2-oxo-4-hydroxy-4-carboxy-5-ureidoimidazoline decarboxylase [Pyrinomonadaceae bacterium]|nr:2-oxo-4-hydroxy-4-carboxy-5-ureidoimidazoline decarboxylase [Pyrinomonadaceae bacterium]